MIRTDTFIYVCIYIAGPGQNPIGNPIANTLVLTKSYTKPLICMFVYTYIVVAFV